MASGIQLTLQPIRPIVHKHWHGFRLRADVTQVADGMPRYVFVYRRHPRDPYTGLSTDEFFTVASFPHIAELPVGEPEAETGSPFFLLDYVELDVQSTDQFEEIWELLVRQVCALTTALHKASNMEVISEFWLGDSPAESLSSASA